jgi:hypothetical protein
LRCHAHDTISGSGVDIIEQDTLHRLRQVREISRSVLRRALAYCQKNINFSSEENDAVLITVYNPLPQEREETIRTFIDIPENISTNEFCLEKVNREILCSIHFKSGQML